MELFDKKGNKIHINTDKFIEIGSGCFGKVYRTPDGALKTINRGCVYPIDPKVLEFLKESKLKGFYKIKDIYYDKHDEVRAYLMKYYEHYNMGLLENKEYLLESIYNLYKSVLYLSEHNIKCLDLMTRNMIKTSTGLKIIDCDFYVKTKNNPEYINMEILLDALTELLSDEVVNFINSPVNLFTYYREYHDYPQDIVKKNIYTSSNFKECIENLMRELEKYRLPREYLLRK